MGAASTIPPSYIRVRAVVWAYGRGQTDTQTCVTTIHFALSTTHAKCNHQTLTLQRMVHKQCHYQVNKILENTGHT